MDVPVAMKMEELKQVNEKTRKSYNLAAEKYSEIYRNPLSEGGKRFGKTLVSEYCCVVMDIQELTGRRERTVEGKHEKTMWRHRF